MSNSQNISKPFEVLSKPIDIRTIFPQVKSHPLSQLSSPRQTEPLYNYQPHHHHLTVVNDLIGVRYVGGEQTTLKAVLSQNSHRNTIGQSSFISFEARTSRPLLKLKHSVLLVMYSWLNSYFLQKERLIWHYFALNTRRASLLRPHPSVISIASAI